MYHRTEYKLELDQAAHFKMIMKKLDAMRKNERICDLTIDVAGNLIHVNKDVVCAASEYFDAMFSHDTKEKQQGVVRMKDIEYFAVKKCIDFVYTGKLSVSVNQCHDVLYCAKLMQLNEAFKNIALFLRNHVDIVNLFDIQRMALKFSLLPLQKFCNDFAILNIGALSCCDEFYGFDASYMKLLLSSKLSVLVADDQKLTAAMRWIMADQNARENDSADLLALLDFTKLRSEYSKYLVREEAPGRISIDAIRKLLSEVSQTVAAPEMFSDCSISPYNLPPNCKSGSLLSGLLIFDDQDDRVLAYFASNTRYTIVALYEVPLMASHFAVCASRTTVYICTEEKMFCCLKLDGKQKTWKVGPDMQHNHGELLQCLHHDGFIYVGGENSLERLNILLRQSKWENIDLKNNVCNLSAMVIYQKHLYLIGGQTLDGAAVRDVVRKFPNTKWTSVSPMHFERKDASAVVHRDTIYVAGGPLEDSHRSKLEMYKDETNVWTILSSFNCPLVPFRIHTVDEQLYSFENTGIKVYNFDDHSWNYVTSCPAYNIRYRAALSVCLPVRSND